MTTQEFKNRNNEVRTLTIIVNNNPLYTHAFEVNFHDGDTDKVSIDIRRKNNFATWLQDNCDIDGTIDNVELLENLLK